MLNLVVFEGVSTLDTEKAVEDDGIQADSLDLDAGHPEAGMPLVARQAMEQVEAMGQLLQRIDEALLMIDERLDVLQPPLTGKVRLIYRKRRLYMTPQFVKFIQKRDGTWWAKPLKAGTATRSIKESKSFEPNAEVVRIYCREGEELLKLRRNVNRLLGNVTAVGKGASQPMDAKVQRIRSALGLQ